MSIKKFLRILIMSVVLLTASMSATAVVLSPQGSTHTSIIECADNMWSSKCPLGKAIKAPTLYFSDLISGPDVGLGDGTGSGTIVTVWGHNLGNAKGTSKVEYCDNTTTCREGEVYYWKDADGTLPSGPANLYESHGMQEVAFSIPDSADGIGDIKITTAGGESLLPFTVRTGSIYHVTTTGNDTTGDGSYGSPWATVGKADSTINAGSTLYVHGVSTGDENTDQVIYNNRDEAMSTLEAQFAYVAYPNTRPEAIGERGFSVYAGGADNTKGFVISKFSIFAAEADEDVDGQPVNVRSNVSFGIEGSADGRAIGNYVTDWHPDDVTGACPDAQQAAITAGAQSTDRVSNFKLLGNHIKEYGCLGTTRFQHTTYFTIRSADTNRQLVAPEMGWNYLQDNLAISGLHYFDENQVGEECGQFTGVYKIHDNVIINQSGAAIFAGGNCPVNTQFEYYNNVAINSGLKADIAADGSHESSIPSAVHFSGGHTGFAPTLKFWNNTFIGWNSQDITGQLDSCIGFAASDNNANMMIQWNDNVCSSSSDKPFIEANYQGQVILDSITGTGNSWFSAASTVVAPTWDTEAIITDPLMTVLGSKVTLGSGSPLIGKSSSAATKSLHTDIYGKQRGITSEVGAVNLLHSETSASVIFSEDFDTQPDWAPKDGTVECDGRIVAPCDDVIPEGWDYVRNVESWHPLEGEPTKKPGQAITSDQYYGSSGKSWVRHHESSKDASTSSNTWGDDTLLIKQLDNEYQEIWASFDIKFDPTWQWAAGHTGILKLFRVSHFDNPGVGSPWQYFSSGVHAPLMLFDLKDSPTWGFRGVYALRCDPQATEYTCTEGSEADSLFPGTDVNTEFTSVLGDNAWHKLTYRMKMNTVIDTADGILQVWSDGVLLFDLQNIAWKKTGSTLSNGWNMVGFGGNTTNWYSLPANKDEQWYAIDNIVISTEEL